MDAERRAWVDRVKKDLAAQFQESVTITQKILSKSRGTPYTRVQALQLIKPAVEALLNEKTLTVLPKHLSVTRDAIMELWQEAMDRERRN